MRSLCLFLVGLFLATAEASAPPFKTSYKNLSCLVQLDDPKDVEYTIVKQAQSFGRPQADGSWTFSMSLENIHAFYFKIKNGRPQPEFHANARFTITATLKDNELEYKTAFYNYAYTPSRLLPLRSETRIADVNGHVDDRVSFLNADARLIDDNVLGGLYVNQDGAKLLRCELRDFSYKGSLVPGPWAL